MAGGHNNTLSVLAAFTGMLVIRGSIRVRPFSATAAGTATTNHTRGVDWRYCRGNILEVNISLDKRGAGGGNQLKRMEHPRSVGAYEELVSDGNSWDFATKNRIG